MNDFPSHDPYKILIPNLAHYWGYEISLVNGKTGHTHHISCSNCAAEFNNLEGWLSSCKPFLDQVRDAYKKAPAVFNYDSRYQRAVYMLGYFPFYMEPIYYALKSSINKFRLKKSNEITISFLGGGALPELLGFAQLIKSYRSDITIIKPRVYDKYQGWQAEIENCTIPLLSYYFDGIVQKPKRINYDFVSSQNSEIDDLHNSDIIVMQNSINDIDPQYYPLLKTSITNIWNNIDKGSRFLIIDLNFSSVHNFMNTLQNDLKKLGGEVELPLNDIALSIRPNISYCSPLENILFTPTDGLHPRRKVNYFQLMVRK
jgi:hypothetical protein